MKAKISTLFTTLLLFLCYLSSSGQGRQFIITINSDHQTTPFPALVDTPIGYNTSTTKYPLLIFLHGTGESSGTGVSDAGYLAGNYLNKLFNNQSAGGPAYYIANGQWPDSFANPNTGVYSHFIVVSPQAPGWSTAGSQLNFIISNFIAMGYRVDLNRIYVTGLSAGGQGVMDYVNNNNMPILPIYDVAAVVPMSMATGATQPGAQYAVGKNIKAWGFGSDPSDVHGVATHQQMDYMNGYQAGIARFTNYSGGHCCWGQFYTPTYKEVINGKSMNIYEWMLLSSRAAAPISTPTANAGANQSIQLPVSQASLSGSASTDVGGTISTYAWTQVSGPSTATITTPAAVGTTVTGLVAGVYTFQLIITDNNNQTSSATVQVTVTAAPTSTPTANAGANQSIVLPISQASLDGSASTDVGGTISTYAWTQVSGPSTAVITTPAAVGTTVTSLVAGVYVFQLTITDNNNKTSTATVQVTVTAAATSTPTANAGANQSIALPISQASLDGSASTDVGGTISTYAWTQVSGPSTAVITTPAAVGTTVTGLVAGVYVFQLTITDNNNITSSATVQVTVTAAATSTPTANAGANQSIALPISQASLDGSASTDVGGTISTYAWTQVSGPSTAVITTPAAVGTTVTGLVAGVYVFQLTITDNNNITSSATVQVTVTAAANPPIANAGANQSIQLPINQVSLDGSGSTDAGGTINSYNWTQLSGPVASSISTPTAVTTTVTGLVPGVYIYQLSVTDNNNLTSTATVQVTVTTGVTPPPSSCGGKRINIGINGNDQGQWVTMPYFGIKPGDTLIISSKYRWSYLSGDGIHGTASCPIVIMNDTGQVEMTAGIAFSNSTYVHVTGTGSANHFYGYYIHSYASTAPLSRGNSLQFNDRSAFCEIDHVDEYMKTYCMWLKEEAQCADSLKWPNWRLDNFSIHDIRARNISQDGFYLGSTSPNGERSITCNGVTISPIPMRLSNIKIYNIILDSVGRSGIQMSGADSGINEIYNCRVSRTGFELNPQQGSGIILGGYTHAYVHDNYVRQTFQHGIFALGAGLQRIENNDVDSSGWLNGSSNPGYSNIAADTRLTTNQGATPAGINSTVYVRNNLVGISTNIDSYTKAMYNIDIGLGYYVYPTWNNDNILCNNLIKRTAAPAVTRVMKLIQFATNCSAPPPNIPPVANAGAAITIMLPVNTATLKGTGTDADGTVASYLWTYVSGPAQYTIVSPGTPQTAINNLVQGVYTFQLMVTDNLGATGTSTVTVTVLAAQIVPPVANAGADQTITLPVNTATLTGSGTKTGGSIVSYAWIQLSGPSTATIATAGQAQTAVNALVQGVYTFQLTVTDNTGLTATDVTKVTVNAAPPPPPAPVANAGADQTITLPVNSVTLTGSGSETGGTITSYAWVQLSGPSTATIVTPGQAQTGVNALVQGVYTYQLTVTDNSGKTATDVTKITVNAAVPPPATPVADAGADQTITLPTNSVTLTGSGSETGGTIVSYAWIQLSGPSTATIATAGQAQTAVNALVQGVYTYQLTVTDNSGKTATDVVKVTVNPTVPVTGTPVAIAGANQTITLPVNTATLTGSGSESGGGTIVSYAWIQLSGPSTATITTAGQAQTAISALVQGVYTFQLTVTDNSGVTATDVTKVTVNAAVPPPATPVANAGANQTITLPVNSATLTGSGSETGGTIVSYKWAQLSGPSTVTPGTANQAQTSVSGLLQGVYTFQLTVTDNSGVTATDVTKITVNAAVPPPATPIANAGANQTITLPTNSVTLTGSGSETGGTIVSYKWTELSGPSTVTPANANQAQTTVGGLLQGVYTFQLTVTDNSGVTATDVTKITVNAALPVPVANAGANQTITLPVNGTNLSGSGSEIGGTIASYKWSQVSGPATVSFADATQPLTLVSGLLVQGVYTLRLTVTDNLGTTASTTMTITVLPLPPPPANLPPVSIPGPDRTVSASSNVTLDGSASYDPDGSIVAYAWVQISGSGGVTIVGANTAKPTLYGLKPGVYVFQLTVTDNLGATNSAQITITVTNSPTGQLVAMAGNDTAIIYPAATSLLLNGGGSYDNSGGTITGYAWTQVSGPSDALFDTPAGVTTNAGKLIVGVYQFRLTVTDDQNATSSDTVTVRVLDNERHGAYVKLYPNPVSNGMVNIDGENSYTGQVKITIYDMTGRIVLLTEMNKQTDQYHFNLPLPNITRGSYVLSLLFHGQSKPSTMIMVVD